MPTDTAPAVDADARRLALEIIASLVNIKRMAAERVLQASGVPDDLLRRFLTENDPTTGKKRSKREAGAVVLDALSLSGDDHTVVRKMIALAADWSDFHLAQEEYKARAVVQKAREMRGVLEEADAAEREAFARRRAEAGDRERRERNKLIRDQSPLLLAQFDQAAVRGDPQQRGYLLEDLLNRTFLLHGIPVTHAFRRNGGGEQIDAAFEMDGWHYLVECRWRERLADMAQLDALSQKVGRSGRQTMGLFLSVNGWSQHVVGLMKQNPNKTVTLMDGMDLRAVLDGQIGLRPLLKAKLSALNLDAEPYRSAAAIIG